MVQGDSAVHTAGARSSQPLTVLVTDEFGRPVAGAAVSFQLPAEGVTGVFASGLRTEVLVTGGDGRASVLGIEWGPQSGQTQVRITASKGNARAGTLSTQYVQIGHKASGPASGSRAKSVSKPKGKWLLFTVVAAGAAAGGLVLGLSGSSAGAAPTAGAVSVQSPPSVQVGMPTITVGKP